MWWKKINKFFTYLVFFRSLRIKILAFVNAFIFLVIFMIAMLLIQQEKKDQLQSVIYDGNNFTRHLSIALSTGIIHSNGKFLQFKEAIRDLLSRFKEAQEGLTINFICLLDDQMNIIASTSTDSCNLVHTKEFIKALSLQSMENNYQIIPDQEVLQVGQILELEGLFKGYLITGISLQYLEARLSSLVTNVFVVTILIFFFMFFIVSGYIDIHIRPITQMSALMNRVSSGDMSARINYESNDEIGILARTFNNMMDKLAEARMKEKKTIEKLCQTEKIAAIGLLASGVAHEVNNPLSGILSCLNTMYENIEDKELIEKYITLIQDGVVRIEKIVKQLLEFSRQRPFMPRWCYIEDLINETLIFLNYQLRKNAIEVDKQYARNRRHAFLDPHQIKQVITNLMLNAIQAMPDGGKIILSTYYKNGYLYFSIKDSGIGIPEENLPLIFNPFFTTREVGQGTGLGLSVSLGIVESHGGKIDVETSPNGSTFTVELPLNLIDESLTKARQDYEGSAN